MRIKIFLRPALVLGFLLTSHPAGQASECQDCPFNCSGVEEVPGDFITLELVNVGLLNPVDVGAPPGDAERLFVVEQAGRIRIIELSGDNLLMNPFLDIRSKVRSGGELGLLGLAFHPNYAENGYFFVYYTRNSGAICQTSPPPGCLNDIAAESVIARYQVTENPNTAAGDSEVVLLSFCQPFGNHNAGQIAFGPLDGHLYIATGDGGSGGDPCNSGQRTNSFLGKILRIDVDNPSEGRNYGIPSENPFTAQDDGILDEIWALGLRNPWRFSFDPETGDLYIADVGQGAWEEVDYQPAMTPEGETYPGGDNYQWRQMEGNHTYSGATALTAGTPKGPVYEYPHGTGLFKGCSITGGHVYRGCRMPNLRGAYFFADYCNDWVGTFRIEESTNGMGETVYAVADLRDRTAELNAGILQDRLDDISSFGVDGRGEMYICDLNDTELFRIVPVPPANNPPVAVIEITPPSGTVPLVEGKAEILLDGSSSDDGDGGTQTLSFEWSKVGDPGGDTILSPDQAQTTVEFTELGIYTYRLTVDDGADTDSAEIGITVSAPAGLEFLRGDSNGDVALDLSDGIKLLTALFLNRDLELACRDAADADDNGALEVTDVLHLLKYLFIGGDPPPPPGPSACGPDETPDDILDCSSYPDC